MSFNLNRSYSDLELSALKQYFNRVPKTLSEYTEQERTKKRAETAARESVQRVMEKMNGHIHSNQNGK